MLLTCLEEPSYIVGPPLAGGLVARGRLAWWHVGGLFPGSWVAWWRVAWWRVGGLFPRSWAAWWRVAWWRVGACSLGRGRPGGPGGACWLGRGRPGGAWPGGTRAGRWRGE